MSKLDEARDEEQRIVDRMDELTVYSDELRRLSWELSDVRDQIKRMERKEDA